MSIPVVQDAVLKMKVRAPEQLERPTAKLLQQ
jgi:hypothetical protein